MFPVFNYSLIQHFSVAKVFNVKKIISFLFKTVSIANASFCLEESGFKDSSFCFKRKWKDQLSFIDILCY